MQNQYICVSSSNTYTLQKKLWTQLRENLWPNKNKQFMLT